jgi:hypothetical protein
MNPILKTSVESARNAKLKAKTTTRSGAVEPSKIPELKKPEENGNRTRTPLDEIAAHDAEYQRVKREQRASL